MNSCDKYSLGQPDAVEKDLPADAPKCHLCGEKVPQWPAMSDQERFHLKKLIIGNQPLMAFQELKNLTGWPDSWAKIWVEHLGQPKPAESAPCPYCGKPLATSMAKMCLECNTDWHDPNNPKKLGS